MKKIVLTLAFVAAGSFAVAGDGNILRAQAGSEIPDEYIVVLDEDHPSIGALGRAGLTVSQIGVELAVLHRGSVLHSYQHVLKGFAIRVPEAAARAISLDPRVKYVEAAQMMSIVATQNNPPSYGLDRIDQRNLPLNNTYIDDFNGAGVHAYIIDTGVRTTHNDFGGRTGNGFTAINDGNGTTDCNGHGTHVAGTVGGSSFGVAKGVTIHPVRVLGCTGSGSNAGVIAGMDFVAANRILPAVANMSLGGGASQATDDAIQRMVNANVAVAVAAGNSNTSACNSSPARAPNAITVGSTTSTDARSSFSNFGTCVDVFAPGSSITSAWSTSNTATNTISGTSMASPHAAGVLALIRHRNPGLTALQVGAELVNNATTGVVGNAGAGSPNRLLFSRFGPAPSPTPTPTPPPGNVVFSATFETGGAGWAPGGTNTATTGAWAIGNPEGTASGITLQNNTTAGGSNALVTALLAGASAGTNDVDGGVTTIDSPAISLPSGTTLNLSFAFYLAHLNNATADDFFRVFVVNTATGAATQVFQELGDPANDAGNYATTTINISSFGGQTVRLRFSAADLGTASLIEAAVDNVTITRP